MLLILLAAATVAAQPVPPVRLAEAAPPPPRPSVRIEPDWAVVPSSSEMEKAYPKAAWLLGVEGRAILRCKVAATGLLRDCSVVSESPPALGFGDAALSVTPLMKMRPATVDGVPQDGAVIQIPVLFGFPDEALPDLPGTLQCYGVFSAWMRKRPDDVRVPTAVDRARKRAEYLMSEAGYSPEASTTALETAANAPSPPGLGSPVNNACFRVFLN